VVFEKAYCEYRLNRVESALKTIEAASEQTDKLKELYGQVVKLPPSSPSVLMSSVVFLSGVVAVWLFYVI